MKKILFLGFILILIGSACKKEVTSISPIPAGNWIWVSTWRASPKSATNPMTPQNTGIQENLVIYSNHYWKRIETGLLSDSGTFDIGHGSYTPYKGAYIYIYDSINYFHSGTLIRSDLYKVSNDTLMICLCFKGIAGSGVKMYIKQ